MVGARAQLAQPRPVKLKSSEPNSTQESVRCRYRCRYRYRYRCRYRSCLGPRLGWAVGAQVVQAHLKFRMSVWSYNGPVRGWDPVVEPWDVLANMDTNMKHKVGVPGAQAGAQGKRRCGA